MARFTTEVKPLIDEIGILVWELKTTKIGT